MLRSTRLSDKAIKTLLILGQRTGQLQLQERIHLYIMISSGLSFHFFCFMALFGLFCVESTLEDENKSVVNRSSVDRRGLLESC